MDLVERLRAAGCVFAEDEAEVLVESARDAGELEDMVSRRVAGEPLEQVVGWAELAGHRVLVSPGVFVPRHRSELLAREAVARTDHGDVVLDLCCGVGALGLVVGREVPDAEVHAADVDPAAVACARRNLEPLGATVHEGDLFAALPDDLRGRLDVVVVNAPYVPTDEIALMPPEAREHEARIALDGGADGLALHRRIAAGCSEWLGPSGVLLIELSLRQAERSRATFEATGLTTSVVHDDDLDATVVIARRAGADRPN